MKPRTGDPSQRFVARPSNRDRNGVVGTRNVASAAGKTGYRTVQTYRLYCLDGMGKVASAEWIEAEDDETAIEAAREMRGGRACELWQNSRLVIRLDRENQASSGLN
jgi:hypothetical protein